MKRRKIVLAILLVMLGIALTYAFRNAPRQERVATTKRTATTAKVSASEKAFSADEKNKVRLAFPERGAEEFSDPERNIFRLTEVPVQPEPPPAPASPPAEPVVERPVAAAPTLPAKPVPHFTFLGFLEKEGQKTVFISSNNEIYLVKAGQPFGPGQEFQVAELTDKNLVIRQTSGGAPITVSLNSESTSSAFAAKPAFKAPVIEGRPGVFRQPRIPKRRIEPGNIPSAMPQLEEETEEIDSVPDENGDENLIENEEPSDISDVTNGDASSLPLRSMLQ